MKESELIPKIVGILFLVLGITAILNQFQIKEYYAILWFCYAGLILMGIGFLKKNKFLIKSQLNILAIPLLVWAFDFVYYFISGISPLNITSYFFLPGPIIPKIITAQHLFSIPLAVYALRYVKDTPKNPKLFSIIQVTLLFILSKTFSTFETNINWVYHTTLNLNIQYYSVAWFVIVFLMIFLTDKALKRF